MNADFCTFLAMPKEYIGTHAATCDRVVQFFFQITLLSVPLGPIMQKKVPTWEVKFDLRIV